MTDERTAVLHLHRYLITNRERMRLQTFRAAGYRIGSGAVESAVRRVVPVHHRRRGSHGPPDRRIRAATARRLRQEVQVKSSGYTAEYGGATGAVINVLTRSGSNAFHGSGLFYWQGTPLEAGRYPAIAGNYQDSGGGTGGYLGVAPQAAGVGLRSG